MRMPWWVGDLGPLVPRRGQRGFANLQQPVPPLVVQRLGNLVLAAHVADRPVAAARPVAAQPGQHDLQLLGPAVNVRYLRFSLISPRGRQERPSSPTHQDGGSVNAPAGSSSGTPILASLRLRSRRADPVPEARELPSGQRHRRSAFSDHAGQSTSGPRSVAAAGSGRRGSGANARF
jgi:hypothetical protein